MIARNIGENSTVSANMNDFFKDIAKEDIEGGKWRDIVEHYVEMLNSVSAAAAEHGHISTTLEVYGSSAEGLKCCLADDYGDVDIMVIPTSENIKITSDMLEPIPDNPGFVRLIGSKHPILDKCLEQHTPYVPTTALKEFHPLLYGDALFVEGLISALKQTSSLPGVDFGQYREATTGAAHSLEVGQSFPTISQQLREMGSCQFNENIIPWIELLFVQAFDKEGEEYTEKHANRLRSYLQKTHDRAKAAIRSDPSPQTYNQILRELFSASNIPSLSDKTQEVKDGSNVVDDSKEISKDLTKTGREESKFLVDSLSKTDLDP